MYSVEKQQCRRGETIFWFTTQLFKIITVKWKSHQNLQFRHASLYTTIINLSTFQSIFRVCMDEESWLKLYDVKVLFHGSHIFGLTNSLYFPVFFPCFYIMITICWLEKVLSFFQVFQSMWEPWIFAMSFSSNYENWSLTYFNEIFIAGNKC